MIILYDLLGALFCFVFALSAIFYGISGNPKCPQWPMLPGYVRYSAMIAGFFTGAIRGPNLLWLAFHSEVPHGHAILGSVFSLGTAALWALSLAHSTWDRRIAGGFWYRLALVRQALVDATRGRRSTPTQEEIAAYMLATDSMVPVYNLNPSKEEAKNERLAQTRH